MSGDTESVWSLHWFNDPGSVTSKSHWACCQWMWDYSVWETSRQLSLVAFIDGASRQPDCAQTQVQSHTHVHRHRYYRWEHSRSVSAMKCGLCFSSHTGHLSSKRLNARPLLSFSLTLASSWPPLWCSEWTECTVADRTIALCDCTKCHHCLSRQKIKMIPLVCVLAGGRWPELGWLGLC